MHQMQLHIQRIQLRVTVSTVHNCQFFAGQKGYYVSDSRKLVSDDTCDVTAVCYLRRNRIHLRRHNRPWRIASLIVHHRKALLNEQLPLLSTAFWL
jgi:hypothetical protein